MAKIKYYFDAKVIKYVPAKISTSDMVLSAIGLVCLTIIIAVFLLIVYGIYFDSPKEIILKNDLQTMEFYYTDLQKKVNDLDRVLSNIIYRDDNIYRTVIGSEPLDKQIREGGGVGGSDRYTNIGTHTSNTNALIIKLNESIDKLRRKVYIESKSQDEIISLSEHKEKLYAAIPAIQPLPKKNSIILSSGYGMRIHPILKVRSMHPGIDFSAPIGTPVYATADGLIANTETNFSVSGYGIKVEIDHGFGYLTRYAHLQAYVVKKGQRIKRGELIGYVGSTGLSTAPHLHYEVFINHVQVNPIHYLFKDINPAEYAELLRLASIENQSLGM